MKKCENINILGICVDKLTKAEALAIFTDILDSNQEHCAQIVTLNPEMVIEAQQNPDFNNLLKDSEIVFPDGIGLVYASKITGQALSERVTGIDFCYDALKILGQKNMSAYFLGAKPGVAQQAANKLAQQIPGLRIVGTHDGYFSEEQEEKLVEEINASGADMLCLALGAPKQEFFAHKYKENLNCKVAIGIGGSFDVWSGNLKRAPQFYLDHNIEWLYRFIQEPSRINRIIKLPVFLLKVALHKS